MSRPMSRNSRTMSQVSRPGYYSPDPMSPTFSPPAEYNEFQSSLRPGTPGSFGRYSVHSSNMDAYDRDARDNLVTPSPSHQGLLMTEDGMPGQRSSTYYFNKEGGAATPEPAFQQYTGRRGASYTAANAAGAGAVAEGVRSRKKQSFIRRRPFLFCFIILAILVIIGVAVGVAVSQVMKNHGSDNNLSAQSNNNGNSGSSSSTSKNNGKGTTNNGTSGSTTPAKTITPFPRWNWTDTNTKVYGVSLGSWLLLERWQLEDWMVSQGGANAWDEYRFTQALGSRAQSVIQDHQNTWVTEADMDALQNAGVNLIRIPIGHWAFIPNAGSEAYVTTGYVDQLNKMLEWCYDRNMYVMLDLHGMPGSQNGDQSSGHNTTSIQWFEQNNQDRSDAFLKAVLDWYKGSNYSSIINSIGVVNEPHVVNDDFATLNSTRMRITTAYYERAYQLCLQYNIPMTFHHGFYPGSATQKMDAWRSFVSGKDPNYLLYEDHPYPGWFQTPEPGADAIQTSVCEYGTAANGYPIPVIIGEFSAIQNLNSSSYAKSYLEMQLATYGWSAGSIFWNFKANTSTIQVLAEADNLMQLYSYVDLLSAGTMPTPGKGNNVRSFYQSLSNPCGAFQTYNW